MADIRILWLAAFIIFLITEIFTTALVSIWFCFGALAALITASVHSSILVQFIVFVIVSAAFLVLTKPLVKKIAAKNIKTNADRILELKGIVTEEINNLQAQGAIKVDGKIWTARSLEKEKIIPVGYEVAIVEIQGVKAIVKPIIKEEI